MEKRRVRPILTVSIEPALKEQIRRQAEEADLSVSRYVEQALIGGLSPREAVEHITKEVRRIVRQLLYEHEERSRALLEQACDKMVVRFRTYLADLSSAPEKRESIEALIDAVFGPAQGG